MLYGLKMSNQRIKGRIQKALSDFEKNQLSLVALKECIKLNGHALEAMPYNLIKDIDEI